MVPSAGLPNVDKKPPSDHRFDEGMRRRLSPVKDFNTAYFLQQQLMQKTPQARIRSRRMVPHALQPNNNKHGMVRMRLGGQFNSL